MSIRVSRRAPKGAVAMAGLVAAAVALSGCSSLGSRTFGDPTTTASVPQSAPAANYSQPMPSSLGGPQTMVAESRFLPPANVGGGWNAPTNAAVQPAWNQPAAGYTQPMATASTMPTVQSQDLPVLSNSSSQGSLPTMQPQPALAAAAPLPSPAVLGTLPTNSSVPSLAAATPLPPVASPME